MISHKELFLLNNAQTSTSPNMLEIERAEGLYLFDKSGKSYMDLVSGFAVSNIGHRHPRVLDAIREQLDKYLHLTVYGEFVQSPMVLFAQKLLSVLPEQLNNVYFTNSGAEATEGALKLAKRYTGRSGIISCHHAYHGSTHGALSVMGNEDFKQKYRPLLPDVSFITFGRLEDLELINASTACVIMETVQGEAGIRVASADYMQKLRAKCTQTGTLLILDEIQAAFGRTGKLFAFEHYNIVPDVLLLAKALGGGMPIGAFIANRDVMGVLKENPILGHITTFGGHPVSSVAGLASLNLILEENLVKDVTAKGELFRSLLVHPLIKEVRGIGLMMCIQLDAFEQVEKVSKLCAAEGVIIDWFLHCETALRIAPPLIITEQEISTACAVILRALDSL
ncbi:Acetylornithine/succinyldiaminopimelate/putrescine aminotransferase [Pedobacter westerhofensis]|uniref:Acetylornithine/succinyldiaminopimelate/putrescine aminotransferase n=1 Tax=Pedobacter westerhofensis TaxID=425512 RepID=A0A521FHM5_9SPHI|nr:aspartate aminotransferase family protein [Pedobacter westerhofensis]SMO95569.1 Acetylornithine/succinyldiaminopimelate/putrescine aminotransferase [Pedobacter westerhofensis]